MANTVAGVNSKIIGEIITFDASYYNLLGGQGVIQGTLTADAFPINREVRLYESKSGHLVKSTVSSENGFYQFTYLRKNIFYTVVATDYTNEYSDVILSKILPS